MKKLEAIFIIAILLISFGAHAVEPQFREHDYNGIEYDKVMDKGKIQIYAEPQFQKKAIRWADEISNIYNKVRRCYPGFMKKYAGIDVNIDDTNKIHIMFTKIKRMNGSSKIIPSDYTGTREVEAVIRCTQRKVGDLSLNRRTAIFVSSKNFTAITIKHELFHVLSCRTLNWAPGYELEESFANKFEGYKCP